MKIEGDELDESIVTLDPYNSDLNLVLSANRYSAHPLTSEGFAFMWAGARATHGFAKGKICYEVKILEHLDVSHLPADEPNPHVVRVGFSVESSTMQLGEDPLSYGYGGTGKISTKCQFRDFGSPFMAGDVILACLNMESDPVQIGYAKNGTFLGWAYRISKNELKGQALFPHVLTKNTSFEVNFGQKDKPYFPVPDMARDFTFANCVPLDRRVCGTRAPKKQDCEMIMMCGLPGAGKSVWAAEYSAKHPQKKYNVLGTNNNIDKMKVMGLPRKRNYAGRWDVLIKMATKCLNKMFEIGSKLRRNYILDQTNVYPNAQRKKMSNFEGFVRKAVVIVPTDQEYKRRCDKRDREEGKEVPDSAVLEMKANFKLPEKGDVFDEVMFIELQREEAEKLVRTYNEEGRAATGPPRKQFRPDSGYGNRGGYNSNQGGPPGRGGYSNRGGYEGNDRKPFGGGDNDRKPYGGGDNDRKPFGGGRGGFDRNSGNYDNRGGFGGNRGGFDGNRGGGFDGNRGSGFDGNRGSGFDGNRGGGFDGNRGGGFDGNRGGGFDGNRSGGFDGKRGGGFNGSRGGGFDGNRRGGGFDGNRRGGFDGNRGGDFDGNRGGSFDGNRGGYDSERRGYEGNRGGNGGYDSNRGDFDRSRGGYDSGYGGSERGRGGYGGGRGGFDRNRGGFEDEPRGYEGSRGGYQDNRGGYSESRGIKRSADNSGYDPSPSGRRSPGGYGDNMRGSSSNYDNRGGGSFRGRGRGDFGGSRPGGNRGGYSNSPDPYSSGGYVKEENYDKESSYGGGYQGSSSRGQSRGGAGRGGAHGRGGYSGNEYGRDNSNDYGSGGYSDYGGQSQGGYAASSDPYSKGYGSQAPIKREPGTENTGYSNSGSRPIQGAARPSGRTTTRWSAAATEETPERSSAPSQDTTAPYSKYGTQVKTEPHSNTGGSRYDNYSNQSFGGYNQSTQPTTGYGSTQSYGYQQQSQPQAAAWPPAQAAAPPAAGGGAAAAADPSQWSQYYQQQQPSSQYYGQYYGQPATGAAAAAPPPLPTYGYSN